MGLNLPANTVNDVMANITFADWIYDRGLEPTGSLNFQNADVFAAQNLALEYIMYNGNSTSPPNYLDYL